jgi:hypothetical protein
VATRRRRRRTPDSLSEMDRAYLAIGPPVDFPAEVTFKLDEAHDVWRSLSVERAAQIAREFGVAECWAQRRFGPAGPLGPRLVRSR